MRSAAFVAFAFGVTMLGTTLPTPLYSIYQQKYDFSSLLTTVIYAVYAGGVLAALLLLGRASDVFGRKRMLFAGLALSAASALVFVSDAGLAVLFIGRVLSGLSAGIFTGTATVAIVELAGPQHQARATVLATAVNMFGLGSGPLTSGLLAEYVAHPLHVPFLVNLGLIVLATLFLTRAPETVAIQRGVRPRPQGLAVPAQVRAVFVPAAIAVFAAFAVFGLLTAIEPGFLATLMHQSNRAVAGAIVFSMFTGSVIGQTALSRLPTRIALPIGCVVLVVGLTAIGIALAAEALIPLILGTIVVGIGQGVSFRSGMAAITAVCPPERRAETISSFFVVAYVGISIPVIMVGIAAELWGLKTAGIAFTIATAVLALSAAVILLRRVARGSASSPASRRPDRASLS